MILQLNPGYIPFNLEKSLDCGQVFRWTTNNDGWVGIVNGKRVTLKQDGSKISFDGITRSDLIRYMNLDLDLDRIISSIRYSILNNTGDSPDPIFEAAASVGEGLRIIRQDPWECLISFICSQNSNIPAIKRRINLICLHYGFQVSNGLYGFPSSEILASADTDVLRSCGTGYRAEYILSTSRFIRSNPEFLTMLAGMTYEQAWDELQILPGVGPKVADCVLLFAYNMYLAVPVDVWIRTIITGRYHVDKKYPGNKKTCSYKDIAWFCRNYFGEYAGYAQQLLFASRLRQLQIEDEIG